MNETQASNNTGMLYAEQVKLLYKNAPVAMVATLINSTILTIILWGSISHKVLISWLLCNCLLMLPRFMLVYRYNHASIKPYDAGRWGAWLIVGLASSGIVWGSASIFLFAAESIAHQIFLAFILAGMVAGGLVTFSVMRGAFLAFSLPALIPVMIRFFSLGDDIHIAMGGMTLLFTILVLVSAQQINTTILSSLKLQFENSSLIINLGSQKNHVEKLNTNLESEVMERKQIEKALRRRDAILSAICSAAKRFLQEHSQKEGIYEILGQLGRSMEISRAYVFENHVGKNSVLLMSQRYEWVAPDIGPQSDNPELQDLPWQAGGLGRWEEPLGQGEIIHGHVRELPATEQDVLVPQAIKSILIVPIFVGREWWGFIGFDECLAEREWSEVEIDALKTAADILGAAMQHKQAEETLLKTTEQLLHAQKMESMGTLTSGIAHNFRNILAGISMDSQLIQMKYKDEAELERLTERINSLAEKGAQLVQEMMEFSHKETRKLQTLNLAKVIRDTYYLINNSFDKMINITIDIPESIYVRGDISSLSQVFMNLCNNARDSMMDGGKLHIKAREIKDRAVVIISDTGHGMDSSTLGRCFDPFFTTKEVGKGTGLGLSTAYGIVKDHGGEINVYSELGQGTTFMLHFPLALVKKKEERKAGLKPVLGNGQKILIVDDEIDILKSIEELLESIDYHTASVTSGKAGIDMYKSWQPDVVLLDRNMPGMDGITCAKRIFELDPKARIVFLSGYGDEGLNGINDKTREFISGYFTKPVDITKLSRILAKLVG